MTGPSQADEPLISLQGVRRVFRRRSAPWTAPVEVVALDELWLDIPRGARFGVVGESGSGKTTLMNLIAGLDRPTSGRVLVAGRDIGTAQDAELGWLRRRLQVVFQDPFASLDPRMRIADIVAEPLAERRSAAARRAVAAALASVGLDHSVLRRYPHQFSGGQRQRIAIARAIVGNPDILVADEAVSALDVSIRATVLQLLDTLATQRELTLIFVSHDLGVIRAICDRVAVLQHGRLVEQGPVATVLQQPEQSYTRQLLAAVPTLDRALAAARARAGSLRQDQ